MKWETIDTAPDAVDVLVVDANSGMMSVGSKWLLEDGRIVWDIDCDVLEEPTHWMLLPEPPDARSR